MDTRETRRCEEQAKPKLMKMELKKKKKKKETTYPSYHWATEHHKFLLMLS